MKSKKPLSYLIILSIGIMACRQSQGETAAAENTVAANVAYTDTLSYAQAKIYVDNYAKHAGTVKDDAIDKTKGLPDTRCIWFGVDRLDSLVQKIKKEHGDGIRFYLATYDTAYDGSKKGHIPSKDYWGYNTLVMVSTKDSLKNNQKYHWDYYNNITASGQAPQGFIVCATPENSGELCPPPANCNEIGATLLNK